VERHRRLKNYFWQTLRYHGNGKRKDLASVVGARLSVEGLRSSKSKSPSLRLLR
jgi:hypothetical protein